MTAKNVQPHAHTSQNTAGWCASVHYVRARLRMCAIVRLCGARRHTQCRETIPLGLLLDQQSTMCVMYGSNDVSVLGATWVTSPAHSSVFGRFSSMTNLHVTKDVIIEHRSRFKDLLLWRKCSSMFSTTLVSPHRTRPACTQGKTVVIWSICLLVYMSLCVSVHLTARSRLKKVKES